MARRWQRQSQPKRRPTRRSLRRQRIPRLEPLERRELLAAWAYNFEWRYYDDVTGDGLTMDDPLMEGATIELNTRRRLNQRVEGVTNLNELSLANPAGYRASGHYYVSADGHSESTPDRELETFRFDVILPDGTRQPGGYPTREMGIPDLTPSLTFSFGGNIVLPVIYNDKDRNNEDRIAQGSLLYEDAFFTQPTVSGVVFEDLNMNGFRDGNEVATLSGFLVYQDVDNDGRNTFEPNGLVGADGSFSFLLDPDPDGTVLRIAGENDLSFQEDYVLTANPVGFTPRTRQNVEQQNFGIYRTSKVTGTLFEDTNGNRQRDPTENLATSGLVFLDRDGDRLVNYDQCFDFLPTEPCGFVQPDGSYVIEQARYGDVPTVRSPGIPPEMYTITRRQPYVVGQSQQVLENVDFGLFRNVQIGGQVYRDTNGDGVRDHYQDPFLTGIDVLLDLGDDGTTDRVAKTDERGAYTFWYVPPGNHRLYPSLKRLQDQTEPATEIGRLIQVNQSGVSHYAAHFGIGTAGEFQEGRVDETEEPPPPQDPQFREKLALLSQINGEMLRFKDLKFQNKLGDKISRFLETDSYGVPLGTIDSLQSVLNMVRNELITLESDGSTYNSAALFFGDIYHLAEKDADRLAYLWNRGMDGIVQMLDQPDATWNKFWDVTYKAADYLDRAVSSMADDMSRAWNDLGSGLLRVVVEGSFDTVINALSLATSPSAWGELIQEMSGYNSFVKSMDPTAPVDQRLGHYLLGVVNYFGAADLATVGAASLGPKAKQLGDHLLRELADTAAKPFMQDVANFFSLRIGTKLDLLKAKGKGWIYQLDEGVPIEANFIHEAGFSGAQVDGIKAATAQMKQEFGRDIYVGVRSTNMESMRHIRSGTAHPKPLEIKAKTISDIDVQYLGFNADDIGLVGLKRADQLPVPNRARFETDDLYEAVLKRYQTRAAEYAEFEAKLAAREFTHDASRGVILDSTGAKPFAGDIDTVYLKDVQGRLLTGVEYERGVEILRNSAGQIQHGAETNIISDVMQEIAKKGIAPGSPEWEYALAKTKKLQAKLAEAHRHGTEMIIEFTPDGVVRRGPRLENLPNIEGGELAMTVPRRAQEFEALLKKMGVSADEFGRLTVQQRVDLLRQRRAARAALSDDKLNRHINKKGIDASQARMLLPQEFSELLDSHYYGLLIGGGAAMTHTDVNDAITAAGRDQNQYELEGDSSTGWLIRRKNSPGPVFFDTNRDGSIAPLDVLRVVNNLSSTGAHQLEALESLDAYRLDSTGDDYVTPLDALVIINHINAQPSPPSLAGEGESVAASLPRLAAANVDALLSSPRAPTDSRSQSRRPDVLRPTQRVPQNTNAHPARTPASPRRLTLPRRLADRNHYFAAIAGDFAAATDDPATTADATATDQAAGR